MARILLLTILCGVLTMAIGTLLAFSLLNINFSDYNADLSAGLRAQEGAIGLGMLLIIAVRLWLVENAVTEVHLERATIGLIKKFFGIPIRTEWMSCYRVAQFVVTHSAHQPDKIRFELILQKGAIVLIAASFPTDTFTRTVHLIRRRAFAYLSAPSEHQ